MSNYHIYSRDGDGTYQIKSGMKLEHRVFGGIALVLNVQSAQVQIEYRGRKTWRSTYAIRREFAPLVVSAVEEKKGE